jgi:hypothetical protein
VPIQSYWTFSDIFEEQGQQASEFSQAFGARSVNGIAKVCTISALSISAIPTRHACIMYFYPLTLPTLANCAPTSHVLPLLSRCIGPCS